MVGAGAWPLAASQPVISVIWVIFRTVVDAGPYNNPSVTPAACHLPLHKGGSGLSATVRQLLTLVGTDVLGGPPFSVISPAAKPNRIPRACGAQSSI